MLLEFTKTAKRILYITPLQGNDLTSIDTAFQNEGSLSGDVKYSYSFDDVNFSQWYSKEDIIVAMGSENTSSITTFLRCLIDVQSNTDYKTNVYDYCGVVSISVNGQNADVIGVEYYVETNIIRNNNNSNIFNPYRGIDNAHHIREQLAQSVSDQFGHTSVYFPTVASNESKSITFKSYKIHNALPPKELKVMLSDDDYNSDIQSYQFYGDVENLEIEITKQEFKNQFGDLLPTPKDSIYINLFKKPFRVISVKEERDFMNKAVVWKFYLGKHLDSVDVNMTGAEQINDFTEFVVYDMETSDDHYNEVEQATGIHDDYEHSIDDSETTETNKQSTMVYASLGMENIKTGLMYNGIKYQRHMYYDKRGNEYLTKYDISKLEGNKYSAALWFKASEVGKSIKLIDLGTKDAYTEQIYVNASGYMAMHVNFDSTNRYITAVGTPIKANSYYGVFYSRFGNTNAIIVLENNNGTISKVQEIVTNGIEAPQLHKQMRIHANKYTMLGNIRFMTKNLSASKVIQYMVDYDPVVKDHLVIDNCTPTITGIKMSTL